jgi:tetratricopeptide (TPR) repeat protein
VLMQFSHEDEHYHLSLNKFESMLKTNNVLFFDSEEFENIIHHYLDLGKISLAKKALKLGLEQHPSSINLQLFQVEMYVMSDDFDKANKLLDKLYELEPNNEEIYIQKANVLSKQDQHLKAIEALKIALTLNDDPYDSIDIYSLIGMEYLFIDDYNNARKYFTKCVELDPEDYSALYNIIYCYDFADKSDEAILFLNTYLDKNPYSEVAWHQLGKQYFNQKSYKKALAAFDFAIFSDDTFIGAYLEKGKVLEKQHQYKEAIKNYKYTLQLDDPSSFALLRIGYCYQKIGNDELALYHFNKTVHEDPLLDKGWIAITKFYIKQNNYPKALYYINKAVNIDSENVLYWKLYAQINHRLKSYEEAEHGYKRTLELGNYEIETWMARADILILLGEYEAAVFNLDQASEFYPENAEIQYRLAGLHYTRGNIHQAEYHMVNGLKFNPDYHFIIDELFPKLSVKKILKQLQSKNKKG